ncbi:hypothetical protein [Rubritalea squalenifaciens]|nr:hypothetical protein [Rubritalea squalenifaciens]
MYLSCSKDDPGMKRVLTFTFMFMLSLLLMAGVWGYCVNGVVYHCTDGLWLDFFSPGQWVHEPVERVIAVDRAAGMGEADSMLYGWSVGRLWLLWGGMVAMCLSLSGIVTCCRDL